MACYWPLRAFRARSSGRVSVGFELPDSEPLALPCGRCFGCRQERARVWSIRCRHEASLWRDNSFVTLTYSDEFLPDDGNLRPESLTLFMKRLRRWFGGSEKAPDGRFPIRFFACGEYGDVSARPHYHLLLFNFVFADRRPFGRDTMISDDLSKLWPYGQCLLGSVTPASAAYVARYCVKKSHRSGEWVDPITGEALPRVAEFSRMSLRPAIGHWWFERFSSDVRRGYAVVDGVKTRVPRYYVEKMKRVYEDFEMESKDRRELWLMSQDPNERSRERLDVKEAVARSKARFFRGEGAI